MENVAMARLETQADPLHGCLEMFASLMGYDEIVGAQGQRGFEKHVAAAAGLRRGSVPVALGETHEAVDVGEVRHEPQ